MKFIKDILPTGARLLTVPMKDTATITVLVLVETGSKYETKNISGISHFLEHMCFKGTKKRPSAHVISTELDSIGADYNAFTGQEYTGYYAKAHYKHFDQILDVIADIYQDQRFDEAEIEREKGVIIEEINMYEDIPQKNVQDLIGETLYGDQPAGWNIAGTKETVSAISKKDFEKYVQNHYVAGATVIAIAGAVDHEDVLKKTIEAFKNLRTSAKSDKAKINDEQKELRVSLKQKKSDQTHLVLAHRSYDLYDDRNYALSILAGVLGKGMSSRLFQLLREKMGVCYYVGAGLDTYTDHGSFQISAGVDTKRVEEVLKAIVTELRRLKEELVSPEELAKVKEYFIGKMYLSLESSDSFADHVAGQEIFKKPIRTPEEIVTKIQAVTAQQVQEAAKEIFMIERTALALVSPYGDEKKLKEILNTL